MNANIPKAKVPRRVLVIDVGGSHVKFRIGPRGKVTRFDSGPDLTAQQMVAGVTAVVPRPAYDAVSIGYPGLVLQGRIVAEPHNLGRGWVHFDFKKALGKPVRLINDAAMQAIGSYEGGRMLFLGLGTGLGSTFVWANTVLPLELGDLPYREHEVIEDYLGRPGLDRLGEKEWKREVEFAVAQLKKSLVADYVVLGGGNTKKLGSLPEGVERGHNRNAFLGGTRLWQIDPRTRRPKWRIL